MPTERSISRKDQRGANDASPHALGDGTHQRVHWLVDGHLDLATIGLCGRDLLAVSHPGPDGCVTIPALRRGGVGLMLATIFTERGGPVSDPVAYPQEDDGRAAEVAGRRQLDLYLDLESRGVLRIVRSVRELPERVPRADEPLPIVLLMECADPIRTPDDAAWWFDAGVRVVGISWARGSRYAGGNAAPGGLTPVGRELVAAFEELGVIHDVSHLSDEGFNELLGSTRGTVVASHSNCRALMVQDEASGDPAVSAVGGAATAARGAASAAGGAGTTGSAGDARTARPAKGQRHLSDAQIRALASRGAVIGLNLFGQFLHPLHPTRRATIADCVAHLDHVAKIAGSRRLAALGSDLDGGFGRMELPEGLDDPELLPSLATALADGGWSSDEVAGFAHRNWIELLRGALPKA